MKKNFNKAMALGLTGVMTMGLMTGCGQKAETPANNDTPAAETTTQAAEPAATETAEVAGMDGWTAFDSKVELKIPVYDRGVEGVPNVSDNYWTKWVQENFGDKYNINVTYEPITRSDVLTSYTLLASANDLPTILMEYDYPKLAQWADEGYLAEYNLDDFAKIAPTYYQNMVDNDQLSYTELNGKVYFALAERPYYNTNYSFVTFYRQDWLDQIGYDAYPTTWAEEKEMLQKLVDAGICKHPLGGAMVTGAGVDQNYGYRTYPQNETEWAMYGDYAIPALGSEANKKLLKRVNEQYNLGLLNPEYYITDAETDKAAFVNGETIQYSGYISANMDWLTSFYAENPDAKLAVKVAEGLVEDKEGGTINTFRPNNPFGMMIGFSSQATEDQIKAAMMYMEWMSQKDNLFTMQWGVEGENFTYNENGDPATVADYDGASKQGFNNGKDYWCVVKEARSLGSVEKDIASQSPVGLPQDFTADIIKNYNGQLKIWESGYANSDCNFAVTIESVSEYQATLLSKYTELRDKLTMCAPEEFDALYEECAKEYMDAGYEEIVNERKEAYESGYSSKLN